MERITLPYRLILGSGSPRRKQLMEGLDLSFTVSPIPDLDEHQYPADTPPDQIPSFLAQAKSLAYPCPLEEDQLLITADTLVFIDENSGPAEILGKPQDRDAACRMLEHLSGKEHHVVTGVHLRSGNGIRLTFSDVTKVVFAPLSSEEIAYYVDKYRPYDKAGAYGVQEWIGYAGIERIEGSFYTVMGLPVHLLWKHIFTIFAR